MEYIKKLIKQFKDKYPEGTIGDFIDQLDSAEIIQLGYEYIDDHKEELVELFKKK